MLIQVSEHRWLAEPEAVWRMPHIGIDIDNEGHPKNYDHGDEWVARMPSGTLEWLSDDEYTKLLVGIKVIHGFSPEFQWGTPA